jgi:hypothetical protein
MSDKKQREFVKFQGKFRWAKVLPGQQEPRYEPKPDEKNDLIYSISVECSEKKFEALKKKGLLKQYELRNEIDKETKEDLGTYFNLKAIKQKTGKDGKPDKQYEDIKVIDNYRKPVKDEIGNGSEGIVIAELVDSTNKKFPGKIIRLLCVQVTNHVPYERRGNNIEEYGDLLEDDEAPDELDADDIKDEDEDDSEDYL